MRRIAWLALLLLFPAVGCGEVPAAPPGQETVLAMGGPTEVWPPTPTPLPYPMPTSAPVTPLFHPSPTPGPTLIVLGAEWAPEAERDTYVSTTRVDEQGTLWVQGEGYSPGAPIIDGQPYPEITVPLGNAAGPFDESRQENATMPGTIGGKGIYFSYAPTAADPLYLYDRQGRRIFACPQGFAGQIQVDQWNNLYLVSSNGPNPTYTIEKYDQQGRLVAFFDLPLGALQIAANGAVYGLTMDWQTWATYYVIRAEYK